MSDIDRIIDYMIKNGSITCKECERNIGTTELRRRVCDIKDRGYTVEGVWEDGENRVGAPTRYKRYFITKLPSETKKQVRKYRRKEPEQKSFWDLKSIIKKLTPKRKQHKL